MQSQISIAEYDCLNCEILAEVRRIGLGKTTRPQLPAAKRRELFFESLRKSIAERDYLIPTAANLPAIKPDEHQA